MSMARSVFRIEFDGLKEFDQTLQRMDDNLKRIVKHALTEYGSKVEEGAKRLAPHKEGDLEASINFDQAKEEGKNIVVYGGSNLEYALARHERPGRGPGTLGKPNWRGYQPGPKYLENAIKATEADYTRLMQQALESIVGGDET